MKHASPARLLILGTGTFALEVADLASDLSEFQVVGFVASTPPYQPGDTLMELPVYWVDQLNQFAETHVAVCALGTTQRWQLIEQALAAGMRFARIVHPSARVSSRAVLGAGSIVSAGVVISNQAQIGEHVILNRGALVGHDTVIGDYATIGPGANIAGNVRVGAQTWIGMGALVIEKIVLGTQVVVGAGALVISDVPDRVQVVGSPARVFQTDIKGR